MTHRQFRLPDLGEGLTEAEIVRWLAEVGDAVTVNQPLVEVETAKAVVEIPSPFAGVLVERHGEAGAMLAVGSPLLTIDALADGPADEAGTGTSGLPASRPGEDTGTAPATGTATGTGIASPNGADPSGPAPAAPGPGAPRTDTVSPLAETGGRTPMLVGYGPRTTEPRRRRRARPAPAAAPLPSLEAAAVPTPAHHHGPSRVAAKPPVRKLARDLGVDLTAVLGTGPGGTISRADVETAARPGPAPAAPSPTPTPAPTPAPAVGDRTVPAVPAPPLVPSGQLTAPPAAAPAAGAPPRRRPGAVPDDADFDPADRVWRVPVVGVRRSMARAMVASVFAAPHATEFLSVDVTETMAARDRIAALPDFAGVRVTPLLLVAKALLTAVRRHPLINSTWVDGPEGERAEIVVHERVNLGIAVAGPRGLVVPNLPDAGSRGLVDLAHGLQALTEAARSDRLRPADLSGGTITITNIGVFGVDTGTPVLNTGEAAILALGAIRPTPWVHQGELAVRTVAHLALSFDHRVVDGELGSAVLADVAAILTDPTVALAWN